MNGYHVIYFERFRVGYILKGYVLIDNKNIATNIYRIQTNDSIMGE